MKKHLPNILLLFCLLLITFWANNLNDNLKIPTYVKGKQKLSHPRPPRKKTQNYNPYWVDKLGQSLLRYQSQGAKIQVHPESFHPQLPLEIVRIETRSATGHHVSFRASVNNKTSLIMGSWDQTRHEKPPKIILRPTGTM